jgi:LPXTG-motif cell wall-anchored protein
MIIHTGDMVNHGGESYQWPLFNDSISEIWDWDEDIKFYGAVGNHEIYTDEWGVPDDDYSNYLDFFDFSDVVDEPGETELYYSFDWQGMHFIFLNTVEEWHDDEFTCLSAQMDWLEADLANDYEFIVVSFHNPMYSIRENRPDRWAQGESLRDTFLDLFIEHEVDIVFNGHDHQYYRTVRNGTYYVVTGGGGAPLYGIQTEDTVWQTGDVGFSDYHYCVAKVNNETWKLEVEVFLMNGTIADSFALELPSTAPDMTMIYVAVGVGAVVVVVLVLVIYLKKRKV